MRITGGEFRGRVIKVPDGKDVRPTTDKVRQAVFNIINGYEMADEPFVLDGFCGTGSLGLEALSRFARGAVFIDKGRESMQFCRANIDVLGLTDKTTTLNNDVTRLGEKPLHLDAADLLFLDPPYRQNLLPIAMKTLSEKGWLADGALCVLECEKGATLDSPAGFEPRDDRTYGDIRIIIMRYK